MDDVYTNDIEEYEHHHQSPMKRNTSKCYIELHRWHTKNTLLTLLPSSELWHSAKLIPVNEPISVRECSATHQIIINIVHSELSDRGYFEKDIHLFQIVFFSKYLASFVSMHQLSILYPFLSIHYFLMSVSLAPTTVCDPMKEIMNFSSATQHYIIE